MVTCYVFISPHLPLFNHKRPPSANIAQNDTMENSMNTDRSTTLFCFSPPVMLATFLIEICFAAYIVWRYKMTTVTRLITSILIFLAIFQGAEYMICGAMGVPGGTWSRLGYASITMLPPLGLHLMHQLAGKKASWLVAAGYASAAAFIIYFVFFTQAISATTCYANYVVFDTARGSSLLYATYYYGWMLMAIGLGAFWSRHIKPHRKPALIALIAGYLAFIVPTTTVNVIDPATIAGIPSSMCGFAVILAFVLTMKVAPASLAQRDDRHSFSPFRDIIR